MLYLNIAVFSFSQNQKALKQHIKHLTSIELNGRAVGSAGGKQAAEYIAKQFETYKIKTYNDSSYFQHFYIYKYLGTNSSMYVNGIKTPFAFYGKDLTSNDSSDFRLTLPSKNIDNLPNKCILIKPKNLKQGISDAQEYHHKFGTKHFLLAFKPRSKSITLYTNIRVPVRSKNYYEVYYYARNFIQPKDYGTEFFITKPETGKNGFNEDSFKDFGLYITSTKAIDTLISNKTTNNTFSIAHKTANIDSIKVQNVIAKIEGLSPEKGAIVVCAHYDHVKPFPREYETYSHIADSLLYMPGADDNASGTAAVIEIANLMTKSNIKPERTTYFCLFDGEEAGFFGSTIFRKQFSDSIALLINFDMIGRNKHDWKNNNEKVFAKAEGKNAKAMLYKFKKQTRTNNQLKIDNIILKDEWKNGSDHAVFRKKTEIMYFFTGNHKDYHTPFDTEDKINYTKLNAFCNEFAELLIHAKF